jgi:hypothetical protein
VGLVAPDACTLIGRVLRAGSILRARSIDWEGGGDAESLMLGEGGVEARQGLGTWWSTGVGAA